MSHTNSARSAAVAAIFALSASLPTAQQSGQGPSSSTFRSGVDLVTIDVSVLDGNRQPVRGLTAAHFTVLEGSVAQRIVSFKAIDLPGRHAFEAAWMREVAPDVASNRFDAERIIVLLLDDYNVLSIEANDGRTTVVRQVL